MLSERILKLPGFLYQIGNNYYYLGKWICKECTEVDAPTRLPLIVSPCIRCAAPEKKNLKQILIFKSSVLTVISH